MRALVTGSSGFVGRHMSRALVERGYHVTGIDLDDRWSNAVSDFVSGDMRRWLEGHADRAWGADLVVHCAAVVGGRATIDGEPLRLMAEDLSLDAALFRWALEARPGRIVYFSSSAAYPVRYQQAPLESWASPTLHERMITGGVVDVPDQTYGWVKLTGERLAAEANAAGIRTHVFRPFSGYGSDQALDYPFPSFIERARRRKDPFTVWGDGSSKRDWVHIDDVVGCVLAAIDAEVLGPVNICTGIGTTFDGLARTCMTAAGYFAPIDHFTTAPQGVHTRVGDPTAMLEFYTPKVDVVEGVLRALKATP